MEYRFQVNLSGIIDLLSMHTYSSPQVFIRELLQNASDAILARSYLEPGHQGETHIELTRDDARTPVLVFRDNGIGLNEEEIHLFLATIGQTSKRDESFVQRTDFIGQFGIGLLSCFVVSDDVVVITRSAKDNNQTIQWRGRADGTYSLTVLDAQMEPGTEVRLHCKPGSEELFQAETVQRLAHHYGSLLRFPIRFSDGEMTSLINDTRPPWEQELLNPESERLAYLDYGTTLFEMEFFDYVPLRSTIGDVSGVAFVLPFSPSLAMKKTHRVYLKNMLLSEQTEGLLPDWAFFVKCVVNANDLRPTASRESFYEDETLAATRAALGAQLRQHLIDLSENSPGVLRALIQLHHLSFKALAVDDEEFFRIFMKWLPFETNMGPTTLTEYIERHKVVRYVSSLDQFKQTAAIAAAQSMCVINAGYTYDAQLIEKLRDVFPHVQLINVDADKLFLGFKYLTLDEQGEVGTFLDLANKILKPFECAAEIRSFSPAELPALYSASSDVLFKRSIGKTKEVAGGLWSSVLDEMADGMDLNSVARVCFNYSNPVVYKISRMSDETLLRHSIQMLYVQAVLFSHRPLNAKEMALLNEGLLGFIHWSADAFEGWIQ
ncbi:MAG: molecular chaperone HtpG [Blastocatellia bacterium]|jgi:molecular chaperone HtpG|nr:molecular chaperone HtpG [Blastocatellia bacterium]